jgi:NAD(P)H dehydrogenase (quinone)
MIAITAVSGRLGRAVAREVVGKTGREGVVGIARTPEKARDLGIEIRKGDYNRREDFVAAFRGIDAALIISGMDAPDKRIGQHRNVIEGARAAGVRKIVYSSIFGHVGKCAFDSIIKSNRQTEDDVKQSGMPWIIGRNGLYIDADLEAVDAYRNAGKIANSAGEGSYAYTSRSELAAAYAKLLVDDSLNGRIYNLCGESVTQQALTDVINAVFNENLVYEPMSVEAYLRDRIETHGEFLGTIIGGIYQGIREGVFDIASDFKQAAGRDHLSLTAMVENYR